MLRRAARRAASALLRRRLATAVVLAAITAVLAAAASRVRLDASVEQLFPVWDPARATYDRYRAYFPADDGRAAVVVAAPDVLSPEGVARVAALEQDLASLPRVTGTLSLATVDTAAPSRFGPLRERLLRPGLDPGERERRLAAARADPLLAWNLVHPDGAAAYVLVALDPAAAGTDGGRRAFLEGARAVLSRHERAGQELVLTGIPPMRASLAELLRRDLGRIVPLALAGVLLVVLLAFRSAGAFAAAFLAALVSLVWNAGFLGLLGWTLGLALGLLPVLVVIVSVGDAVHVVSAFQALRGRGLSPRQAAEEALADSAVPCLVTEGVLAVGFASLAAVNVLAIVQLGIVSAVAMLLTWCATMAVTPLVLSVSAGRARPLASPAAARALWLASAWPARVALRRPLRVVIASVLVAAAAAVLASRVEQIDYAYDDLRPGSPLESSLRAAERLYGGYIPIVVLVEAEGGGPDPALDPACLALADRISAHLRRFPEVRSVTSASDLLRALHLALAGADAALDPGGLPEERDVAARELALAGNGRLAAPFVSADRRALAVVARVPDVGTRRAAEIFGDLDAWLASQASAPRAPGAPRVSLAATGPLRLLVDVDQQLVGGLLGSLGGALVVSLAVMSVALRSWRLGLVALVPNVAPLVLVLAFMAVFGIPLQASTVLVFSIALVVADDDTIQVLERVRLHHAAVRDRLRPRAAHRRAVLAAVREAGPPMVVSAVAVSLGFSILLLASLRSTAWVGLLLGATLLSAAGAELFLTPLLVAHLRPLSPPRRAARADPDPRAAPPGGGTPPAGTPR